MDRLDSKFRKGALEHTGKDGDWAGQPPLWFIDATIEEHIDALNYLIELRKKFI